MALWNVQTPSSEQSLGGEKEPQERHRAPTFTGDGNTQNHRIVAFGSWKGPWRASNPLTHFKKEMKIR